MICPKCGSKLAVKDSREDGFSQIRQRICKKDDCDFEMTTEEQMVELKKAYLNPASGV